MKNREKKLYKIFCYITPCVLGLFVVVAVIITKTLEGAGTNAMEEIQLEGNNVSPEFVPFLSEKSLKSPLIAIDGGHGGEDEGCAREGIREKDINLNIALELQKRLSDIGYQVIMIREGDQFITKEDRVKMANEAGAHIYVSIHQNACEKPEIEGIETWYDGMDESGDSMRLAKLIHQETLKSTNALSREVKDNAEFYVTGKTKMPACLIETGFLSNIDERKKLRTKEYQKKIVEGIVQGIEYYFYPKTMYLTFDSGPSVESTSKVLDVLKEKKIKATFFLVGEKVRKNPEIARKIVANGHTIGISSFKEDNSEIYQTVETYIEDFEKAYKAVLEVTGVGAKIFGFPERSMDNHGEVKELIIEEMTARGFVYYDWNAELKGELILEGPEAMIENAKESIMGKEKVVLLAHDTVYNTALCLDRLIEQFPEYKMEVLAEK